MQDLAVIEKWIRDFVIAYGREQACQTRWREPIIGVAGADDPLYAQLKRILGPHHKLPGELVPGARSVIVYFVPFDEETALSNIPGEESSREWDYAYIETNNLLAALSAFLYEKLSAMGYAASNLPPTYNYDPVKLVSDWSHRSSGYIAGLGTFGVNNMLITDSGCCGRLGSVITTMPLPPTTRPTQEYCLYKARGTCRLCVDKCVNDALPLIDGEIRFDRHRCDDQLGKLVPHYPIGDGHACGKCLVGLPCSTSRP